MRTVMSAERVISCYDANGNQIQKMDGSATNYTYDAENRVEPAGSGTALLSWTVRTQTGLAPCVKTILREQSGQWL